MFFLRCGAGALWTGWLVQGPRRPLVKDDIFVGAASAAEELACNENFVQPMIYNAERVHNSCKAAAAAATGQKLLHLNLAI